MSKQDIRAYISVYLDKGFNNRQLEEIALGFEHGLSFDQVDVYAKPEYNRYQMCQIRTGIQNGLSVEQLSVFANPIYNETQMCELRVASELGMTSEEISELANPNLSWQEMWRKRVKMRENAEVVSLSEAICKAEATRHESGAPEHFKQEDLELYVGGFTMELEQIFKSEDKFQYMLLSRMRSDCNYYLGNGSGHPMHLWAGNEKDHIAYMKGIWNHFAEGKKPEWLTMEQILEYEKKMVEVVREKPFMERAGAQQEFLYAFWFAHAKELDSSCQDFLGMSREEYNSWCDGRLRLYDGSYHEMEASVFRLPDVAVDKIRNEIAHPLMWSEAVFSNDVNKLLPEGQQCFVSVNDDAKLAYVYDGGDDVLAVISPDEIMYREDFAELIKDVGIEATEANFDKVWETFRSGGFSQGTLKDSVLIAINNNLWPSFSGYLEHKKSDQKIVSVNFGNIISELEQKNLKLCFVGGTHDWGLSLEDNQNNLYRIEPFFDQAWLPKLIERGAVVKFEQVDKSIPELNVEGWEKKAWNAAEVKRYIETVFANERPTIAKNVLNAYNGSKQSLDAVIRNANEQRSEGVASSSEGRSEKNDFQL